MSIYAKISRRTWLKGMAIFSAAGVSLMLASTAAQAKASKAAVHYQDHPNGKMRMCQTCKFFISTGGGRSGMMGCPMGGGMMGHGMMGAGACQVVEGRISPMGYCDLYAPQSA
jgi:anaerobic selenocysteine-containing dehydrogenase